MEAYCNILKPSWNIINWWCRQGQINWIIIGKRKASGCQQDILLETFFCNRKGNKSSVRLRNMGLWPSIFFGWWLFTCWTALNIIILIKHCQSSEKPKGGHLSFRSILCCRNARCSTTNNRRKPFFLFKSFRDIQCFDLSIILQKTSHFFRTFFKIHMSNTLKKFTFKLRKPIRTRRFHVPTKACKIYQLIPNDGSRLSRWAWKSSHKRGASLELSGN